MARLNNTLPHDQLDWRRSHERAFLVTLFLMTTFAFGD